MVEQLTEKSACGIGFVTNRTGQRTNLPLVQALRALSYMEHRGACGADGVTGDGSGVMTDIPFEMLGYEPGEVAVGMIFITKDRAKQRAVLQILEASFAFLGAPLRTYRRVPVNPAVLGPLALESLPDILQLVIGRPPECRTAASFNAFLYNAKQAMRSKLREADLSRTLSFASLSTTTVVYKALTAASQLAEFYPDLQNPGYTTRFGLFHRRFSTNTRTTWDKAQPLRLVAHNGEINTIAGNRSWAYSREQALGVRRDELLTHQHISDSGNLNEMVEALKYRSGIPHVEDILSLMMPPATGTTAYHTFWGRAVEPWDGPACVVYSDGKSIGARLDRNGFRPCRWAISEDTFYLASEAGVFDLDESSILRKGTLRAGTGIKVELSSGEIHHREPCESRENRNAVFHPRLLPLEALPDTRDASCLSAMALFGVTQEDMDRMLMPMMVTGKEPIGSMGDTARLAILSEQRRSFYDYFFQTFAQVTNPPLDFLREKLVTDLTVHIGRRPNIFAPKELLPATPAFVSETPILTLEEMVFLKSLTAQHEAPGIKSTTIQCTFEAWQGGVGLRNALKQIAGQALQGVGTGSAILILTDRDAAADNPPIPSLLALRAVVNALNGAGRRLQTSIVLDAGDVLTAHDAACTLGFGATALCPRLAFDIARHFPTKRGAGTTSDEREANIKHALESGVLKVMSKMGISVVRSYQSSKLFTILGLNEALVAEFFPGVDSPVGGLDLKEIARRAVEYAEEAKAHGVKPLPSSYQLKEQSKGREGETHSMTAARARLLQRFVRDDDREAWQAYLEIGKRAAPTHLRDLLTVQSMLPAVETDTVEGIDSITCRFGAGAMSFGAINQRSQRDLFESMQRLGGRSNSGEGGENPFYFEDGTSATTKQIASGRFGVTAEYLISGDEIEIKIAQGAKPGEGGQLMGVKVNADIARARHAEPGVDLISPPPQHDIYSIEDLKELIYELRQLAPNARICVKLVSGAQIGTIAIGVAKAGANVIQISGGDGGTGAATITSMKHAGLPWELGISRVHHALTENGLRKHVVLRVDGGLETGDDVIKAALLGAEEFGFGKLLLIGQGCIMARICEKNTCPTGIATHDPKFVAKYKGQVDHVVTLMQQIARDMRETLAGMGVNSVSQIIGHAEYLEPNKAFERLFSERGLDVGPLLKSAPLPATAEEQDTLETFEVGVSALNQRIVDDTRCAWADEDATASDYTISSDERAVPARLNGLLGARSAATRRERTLHGQGPDHEPHTLAPGTIQLNFTGSAGQGFGAFLVDGISMRLAGEANDSVCKSMSGGTVTITPHENARFTPENNAIIGNCALYGATGGTLFALGLAGDRFAVRNSGANAVIEGAGLHACEYMTGGTVVVLGPVSFNLGAGMTGGEVFIPAAGESFVNAEYLAVHKVTKEDDVRLRTLVEAYAEATESGSANRLLAHWESAVKDFRLCKPQATS